MLQCVGRTAILYLALLLLVRLLGKRQLGQMEPAEFVVTMMAANLATVPLENAQRPLAAGIVPMATVLILELLLSFGCILSVRFRRILCGKPVILIDNGQIVRRNLRSTRISLDELTELLRQKDVLRLETVQYAILETDGNLSVFPYPKFQPPTASDLKVQAKEQSLPYTIIGDGRIYETNLRLSGKDRRWLEQLLKEKRCRAADVFLLTVDRSGTVFFLKKR